MSSNDSHSESHHPAGYDGEGGEGAEGGPAGSADGMLRDQLAAVVAERDEAVDRYKRALADFQNYQRRALENEREAKRQGITSVLGSIIPVLDNFDLALAHRTDDAHAGQVIDGVKVIREELVKALAMHGVGIINPAPNEELDPQKHQVIVTQPAAGVEPGNVSMTLQVGYTLETRVVRPAKVAVAPQPS